MFQVNVTSNLPQVQAALAHDAKQAGFALVVALTRTARDIKPAEIEEMRSVFDRPTRYTLNSVYVDPATKAKPEARVWLKDGDRPTHYLVPQIAGGGRPLKRFEEVMVQAGYMGRGERAVPGAGAQLDAYGNMSRGQIVQILSQLRAFNLAGSDQNATGSRRSRAKRAQVQYFLSRGRGAVTGRGAWKNGMKEQHLPRGVWMREAFGAWGSAVKPVLLFVSRMQYRLIFKFREVAERVVARRFGGHFDQAYAQARRTARPAVGAPR